MIVFLSKQRSNAEHLGRVAIGLGLMMLALQLIVAAARPLTQTAGVKAIFTTISGDPLLDLVIAAAVTVLAYSSLAVVLLVATLTASQVIGLDTALPLVLGANIGSGVAGGADDAEIGCRGTPGADGQSVLPLGGAFAGDPVHSPDRQLRRGLRIPGCPGGDCLSSCLQHRTGRHLHRADRTYSDAGGTADPGGTDGAGRVARAPSRPARAATPSLALTCAAREALRIGDFVEQMLAALGRLMQDNHRSSADEIRRLDDVVDSLYKQVKFYLTQVSRTPMGERESCKWTDIISFTINPNRSGDIIEKSANDVVSKNIERNRNFSDAGRQELCDLHARLVANLRLAMNVFINNDVNDAEKLLAEKVKFRELELVNYDKHLVRLADHTVQSIETSSLHLDLMRDLEAHQFALLLGCLSDSGSRRRACRKAVCAPSSTSAVTSPSPAAGGSASRAVTPGKAAFQPWTRIGAGLLAAVKRRLSIFRVLMVRAQISRASSSKVASRQRPAIQDARLLRRCSCQTLTTIGSTEIATIPITITDRLLRTQRYCRTGNQRTPAT